MINKLIVKLCKMISYESVLETSAVITTIFQFLTGGIICRKYFQKKSTGDSSGFPFVCGFLSCSLWLRYGYLTGERIVTIVNIVGSTLMLLYTMMYYVFTVNKKSYVRQFAIAFIILLTAILYTKYEEDKAEAVKIMGLICCGVTVLFFAAPLTMLLHVIKVKNTESLPFPLISASFLVSLQWVIYGLIIDDAFIQIPNFLGCILSGLQLSLFICYPPKSFTGPSYKLLDQNSVF